MTAPTPWPVSKSTLQAFSILAPYFSVLLIYRFIVRHPVVRPLNLARPPFVLLLTTPRSFFYTLSLSLPPSLFPRLHRGLTSDRHVTTLVPEQTSSSLTYHRWIHKSFGTEISIQALLLLDAGHIFFDALTSVKSRS